MAFAATPEDITRAEALQRQYGAPAGMFGGASALGSAPIGNSSPIGLPPTQRIAPSANWSDRLTNIGAILLAASGNQAGPELMQLQQSKRRDSINERTASIAQARLDAQQARDEARLAKPQVHFGEDGSVSSYDPTTGAVSSLAQGRTKPVAPTDFQRNYEYIKGIAPERAESYLNAYSNPQALMTDPTTGAVGFYPKGGVQPQTAPRVASQAEYQALPPGASYIAPDGSHRVKGGAGPGQRTFP